MEKLVRYRKAFYEKENDNKNGNKRKDMLVSLSFKNGSSSEKMYRSVPHIIPASLQATKIKRAGSNSAAFCEQYAEELISNSNALEKQPRFLFHHEIDSTLRSRMLDWMVEVISSYKFGHKTYFDGIQLMDRYFEVETESLAASRLHIIGVQTMLIASKMEEVFPLKIKTVYEKIAHRKIPIKDLVEMEERISKKLNYKLGSWTVFDVAMLKITNYLSKQEIGSEESIEERSNKSKRIEEYCSYLCKFVVYDYDLYCEQSCTLLAECVVRIVFEIMEISCHKVGFYTCPSRAIDSCKIKVFKLVRNFGYNHPGLTNIFKFTKKEIVAAVDKHIEDNC